MNVKIPLGSHNLTPLPSGALWWAQQDLLCISDLHLCKSERVARRTGTILPPYETDDTLARLSDDLERTQAKTVICLGDSFDDLEAANNLSEAHRMWIARLQAGRRWIWIEGNHDPGPISLGGSHVSTFECDGLTFRHIADPGEKFEISGHYHPKVQVPTRARVISRPAFLYDASRLVLPAYGTYTGGLFSHHPILSDLMSTEAKAVLLGQKLHTIAMPRC